VAVRPEPGWLGRKERFGALATSLEGLLEYTPDDTREATFEASLFGELFREMLDARFGGGLARGLRALEAEARPGGPLPGGMRAGASPRVRRALSPAPRAPTQ
jgi:hypothetical protein